MAFKTSPNPISSLSHSVHLQHLLIFPFNRARTTKNNQVNHGHPRSWYAINRMLLLLIESSHSCQDFSSQASLSLMHSTPFSSYEIRRMHLLLWHPAAPASCCFGVPRVPAHGGFAVGCDFQRRVHHALFLLLFFTGRLLPPAVVWAHTGRSEFSPSL